MVTFYKIIVQYQNQEIDIDILCVCISMSFFFWTDVDLCNSHLNQDPDLFHHHKDLPRVAPTGGIDHPLFPSIDMLVLKSAILYFVFYFIPPFMFHYFVFAAFL